MSTMRAIVIIIVLLPNISFSQKARNESTEYNNIYAYCINAVIDSLSQEEKNEFTLIIVGDPAKNVIDWALNMDHINAENNSVTNSRGNLKRQYRYLINKRILRLLVKDLQLRDSRILVTIFMFEKSFENRRKGEMQMFKTGRWTFFLKYNNESDSFIVEKIDSGLQH